MGFPPRSLPFSVIAQLASLLPQVVFYVETCEPVVALSLDDGPHPTLTRRVLELLERREALATFFLIGERADENRRVVADIADQGHELGNHTWKDESSAALCETRLTESVVRTETVLRKAAPSAPLTLLRPGGGLVSKAVLSVSEAKSYRCVLASVYPNDVRLAWTRWIVADVVKNVRPGAIIVLHEGTDERRRVLPILERVLDELEERKYRVTTVSQLLALSR